MRKYTPNEMRKIFKGWWKNDRNPTEAVLRGSPQFAASVDRDLEMIVSWVLIALSMVAVSLVGLLSND